MAAIKITMNGTVFPKGRSANDRPIPCVIVADAWYTGLGVGGGPIFPEEPPDGGDEHPEHPWIPPGESPPDPPELPPGTPPNTIVKPPPEGGWGYITDASGALQAVYNPGSNASGPKHRRR